MAAAGGNNEDTHQDEGGDGIAYEAETTGHTIPLTLPNREVKDVYVVPNDYSTVAAFKARVVKKHYATNSLGQKVESYEHELVLIIPGLQNSEKIVLDDESLMADYEEKFTKCSGMHLQIRTLPHTQDRGSVATGVNMRAGNNS